MKFPLLIRGSFISRDNRFRATVQVNGEKAWAHVANSGRLTELFQPGRQVWLAQARSEKRVTAYDLKLVEYAGVLVSADARLPNPLFAEALAASRLKEFDYQVVRREVTVGGSRLDFQLSTGSETCWVETKSVTLVKDDIARFPDAPTDRGVRHLLELIELRNQGFRTAVVFIVQRPDTTAFTPNSSTDPLFASTLLEAEVNGVEIYAYRCDTSLEEIVIAEKIPLLLKEN